MEAVMCSLQNAKTPGQQAAKVMKALGEKNWGAVGEGSDKHFTGYN